VTRREGGIPNATDPDRFDDVGAEAVLLEDLAPRITGAVWEHLPLRDRAIGARWSGDLWRSEGDQDLGTGGLIENETGMLRAGDISSTPSRAVDTASASPGMPLSGWRHFGLPRHVSLIARVDRGLEALVNRSARLGNEGPRAFEITRSETLRIQATQHWRSHRD